MTNIIKDKVEQVKKEILEDIKRGVVPSSIKNFAELHQFVDANCYGGFCEDDVFEKLLKEHESDGNGLPDSLVDLVAEVQDQVDEWLKTGN